jgi:glutamate synthase domain-containing protein 1
MVTNARCRQIRKCLPIELVSKILAPPFWSEIDHSDPKTSLLLRSLRQTYGSLLMNGPFSVVVAHHGEMIGLTDRIKLRPLIAASKDEMLYLSSEEASIRLVSPQLDRLWAPRGGEPVIGRVGGRKIVELASKVEVS